MIENKQFLLGQTGVLENQEITYTITAIGTVWNLDLQNNWVVTTDPDLLQNSITLVGNSDTNNIASWPGFTFPWAVSSHPEWGITVYEVRNSSNSDIVFYLDNRDHDFIHQDGQYSTPDFAVLFRKEDDNNDYYSHFNFDYPVTWERIFNEEVVHISKIHNVTTYNTYDIPNFWNNSLVWAPDIDNLHPRLIWGPFPSTSLPDNYIIEWKNGANWLPLDTLDSEEFNVVDGTVELNNGPLAGHDRHYRVKGLYAPSTYTNASNSVAIELEGQNPEKISVIHNKIEYKLSQNYPNPFNPSTTISFSIPEKTNVKLSIYDVLGNEIIVLNEGIYEKGNHSVSFSPNNLASGIYFYKISTDKFSESRKMILIK